MVKPEEVQLYKFGEFRLDAVRRVLLRDHQPVQLPSRALDVLLALLEQSQSVIDRDELMRLVWGDRVVEENNLNRHISTLRRVLGEGPNDHRYIVTTPGRGYSFVAQVERVATNGGRLVLGEENGDSSLAHNKSDYERMRPGPEPPAQLEPVGLTQVQVTSAPFGHAQTAGGKKNWFWATALIVALAGGGLLGFKIVTIRSKPAAVKTYRDWEMVRLTRAGGSVSPTISRDGRYVAYVNFEFGRSSVWIHQLATSTQQQLIPPEKSSYRNLLFTADGSELYFVRVENSSPLGTLYRIPVLGGSAKKLRDDIVVDNIMLSSDGGRLAFTRRNREGKSEIVIADTDGVEERVLLGRSPHFPAWSPDGKVIAFSSGNAESGGEKMGLIEVRLSDGAQREITSRKWQHVGDKSWLQDGSGLIVSARDLKTAAKQLWFVAYPSGETRPISNDIDNLGHVSLTADARMLVAEQLNLVSEIWSGPLANVAGGQKVGVWGQDGLNLMPDGRILYSAWSSSTSQEVWVMNADGAEREQLTFDSANDFGPTASPDGRHIVFVSNRTGRHEIWRMNPDGGNLLQLTHSDGANAYSISPDGRWVIYLSSGVLSKVPIDGGEPVQICKNAVGVSSVAPDGRLIAYFDQGKDFWGIAVSSFQNGAVVKRFEVRSNSLNNTSLKWTPDGKALLYSASSDGVANIWAQPLDGSPARLVTDFKADGIFRFDVSSDGKKLICARGGWKRDIVLVKNLR
jgi:Tol biopolymer transport system component/DNA-binding winged helix-turn-helix (wHTH) protein